MDGKWKRDGEGGKLAEEGPQEQTAAARGAHTMVSNSTRSLQKTRNSSATLDEITRSLSVLKCITPQNNASKNARASS